MIYLLKKTFFFIIVILLLDVLLISNVVIGINKTKVQPTNKFGIYTIIQFVFFNFKLPIA